MFFVIVPHALALNGFTRGNARCTAYNSDEITVTFDVSAQDAKTGFLTVEGDAFNRALKGF